jgi:3-hydroxyacyl-CoA dehydrogenase
MRQLRHMSVLLIATGLLGASIAAASAQSNWDANHPRREQVNDRLQNQNQRIKKEVREGEISKAQARQLHQEDHAIRQEERAMSSVNGGHITRTEQKALNHKKTRLASRSGTNAAQFATALVTLTGPRAAARGDRLVER